MRLRLLLISAVILAAACGQANVKVGAGPSASASPSPPPSPSPVVPPASPSPHPSVRPSPQPSTSPTPAVPAGDCPPSALTAGTATDRPTYHPGETVTITVSVRNVSAQGCRIEHPYSPTFGTLIKITTPAGSLVWQPGARANGVLAIPQPVDLAPGAAYLWTTALWDERSCTGGCASPGLGAGSEGGQVPAGTYLAATTQDPPVPAAPASFAVSP